MGVYGPYSQLVVDLLAWIDSGRLLRGTQRPSGPYEIIHDFQKAVALAHTPGLGCVGWTELRDNADASLYPVGLLDMPEWQPHKESIEGLLFVIGDKVHESLPKEYMRISSDVAADLRACATCLAVHGKLDEFHRFLWDAYASGGWPCGCTGPSPAPLDGEIDFAKCKIAVFWPPAR
jgi:hypothetical protein